MIPGKLIDDDALRLFPVKAFKASASFLQQFDEDDTPLRDDPLRNVVVKVVVIVFAFVFTLLVLSLCSEKSRRRISFLTI